MRVAELVAFARSRLAGSPDEEGLAGLAAALAVLDAAELDLARRLASLPPGTRWRGEDLLEAARGHGSLFLLPRGGAIPPHDHPGMTVLTRVLLGRARVRAWDWISEPPAHGERALARPVLDATLDARSPVLWTRPRAANVHRVDALEPVAFVDLLVPWYDDDRPCSYFDEVAPGEHPGSVWLRRVGRED